MARDGGLLRWQWSSYGRNHRDRLNLVLHMIAVPMFIAGVLAAVSLGVRGYFAGAMLGLAVAALGFFAQAIGHQLLEDEAPIPFDGPADFVSRVFVEQFITFPRFVLSGEWFRQLLRGSDQDR